MQSYQIGYRSLQIVATILIQIPCKFDKPQKNVLLAPSGSDGRLDDLADERQQLALAFCRRVGNYVIAGRFIEVEFHR
ncbi:hypothetical protein A4R29_23465 [Mesorhizobium ciceri biovar biserrulae]|nr:hypothetical protein A4R28_16700 [Mesorhizobium ciceri]AMY02124.1 hypothetical protein A4R29_23465 [Mesorhizobium ciceri biovar biserrulae]